MCNGSESHDGGRFKKEATFAIKLIIGVTAKEGKTVPIKYVFEALRGEGIPGERSNQRLTAARAEQLASIIPSRLTRDGHELPVNVRAIRIEISEENLNTPPPPGSFAVDVSRQEVIET